MLRKVFDITAYVLDSKKAIDRGSNLNWGMVMGNWVFECQGKEAKDCYPYIIEDEWTIEVE